MNYRELNLSNARYYGVDRQTNQLMEELAELIQAVSKWRREYLFKEVIWEARNSLIEEIADVEIMIEQIKYLTGISDDRILEIKKFKINREKNRIIING